MNVLTEKLWGVEILKLKIRLVKNVMSSLQPGLRNFQLKQNLLWALCVQDSPEPDSLCFYHQTDKHLKGHLKFKI